MVFTCIFNLFGLSCECIFILCVTQWFFFFFLDSFLWSLWAGSLLRSLSDVRVVFFSGGSSLCATGGGWDPTPYISGQSKHCDYSNKEPAETWMSLDFVFLFSNFCSSVRFCAVFYPFVFFQLLHRCLQLKKAKANFGFLPGGPTNHMALFGGALFLLGCLRSHVRLMHQSPTDSFRLWLEQPTVRPDSGSFHRRTLTPFFFPLESTHRLE